jgi:hypothetical protein
MNDESVRVWLQEPWDSPEGAGWRTMLISSENNTLDSALLLDRVKLLIEADGKLPKPVGKLVRTTGGTMLNFKKAQFTDAQLKFFEDRHTIPIGEGLNGWCVIKVSDFNGWRQLE